MTPTLSEHFSVRPATMDDVQAVVELLNACAIEQIGKPRVEEGRIRADWQQPAFNLETDTLVVLAPDGKLVGHAMMWDSEPHVRTFFVGDVHPEYKGQGIGAALCQWAEERARQSLPKAPPGARVLLWQDALTTDEAAQELLRQQGYRLVRYTLRMVIEMDAPPPEPVAPDGITIRPFVRGQEERAVILALRESFQDHWGYVETPLEEELEMWMHFLNNDPQADPSLWFVAVDDEQSEIAGVCLCNPAMVEDPDMGWVLGLGVRRPWRRQGLALALLRHSMSEFYQRGKRKVGLGVDAQSLTGATRLYEKAGMHVDRQFAIYEKELRPGEEPGAQTRHSDKLSAQAVEE